MNTFEAYNAPVQMFLGRMEVILRLNNSLFQCDVHQIQSYNCLLGVKLITSTHSTSELILGAKKISGT